MQKEKDLILDKVLPENKENDGDRNSNLTPEKLWELLDKDEEKGESIRLLVENQGITASILSFKRKGDFDKGINILWVMACYEQWDLIRDLLKKQLIDSEMLLAKPEDPQHGHWNFNVFAWLAYRLQWDLIDELLKQRLITSEMLLSKYESKHHIDYGTNGLWWMANYNQHDLIKKLLVEELITPSMLLSKPENSDNLLLGTNVIWQLACMSQWDLIEILLKKRLITSPMLLSKSENQEYDDYGTNVLWIMVDGMQWDLIRILVEQELITTEMLLSRPEKPGEFGPHVLNLIAYYQQWDLIEQLASKINTELLLSKYKVDNDYAANVLELILESGQFGLIKKLLTAPLAPLAEVSWTLFNTSPMMLHFIDKNDVATLTALIELGVPPPMDWDNSNPEIRTLFEEAKPQLAHKLAVGSSLVKPPEFKFPEFNVTIHNSLESQLDLPIAQLWALAVNKNWPLVKNKIQTQEKSINLSMLLFNAPEAEFEQGINTLWWMVRDQQWALIESLLDEGLIISEMLLSMPQFPFHGDEGTNVVWWIVFGEKWELMRKLLENNLIMTSTLFSRSADEDNQYFGYHVLDKIVFRQKWDLIDLLIPQINTELLLLKSKLHGSNVLELILETQQFELIKKLLTAPLAPLAEVPWTQFITSPMMVQFIDKKEVATLTRLIELGVPLPCCPIMTLFEKVKPRLPHRLASGSLEKRIPGIVEFGYKSQRKHWRWRAEESMKQEAIFVGFFVGVFQNHTTTGLPYDLIWLILFYALGNQQGITYSIPKTLDSATSEIPNEPKYKIDIFKHVQKGFGMFADLTRFENNSETVFPALTCH